MALRAVPDHPKFADLKARLGRGKGETLGYLEALWHFCGRFTPRGNIGKYSDRAIEGWIEWPGEPGLLISSLIESGWLDPSGEHRLVVHDWGQHADHATRMSIRRANLEFIRSVRTPDIHKTYTGHTKGESGCTPETLPEPEPVPDPDPDNPPYPPLGGTPADAGGCEFGLAPVYGGGNGKPRRAKPRKSEPTREQVSWFETCWERYWRRQAKQDAIRAFAECCTNGSLYATIAAAITDQTPGMMARDECNRPCFGPWLRGRRWEDEPEKPPQPRLTAAERARLAWEAEYVGSE